MSCRRCEPLASITKTCSFPFLSESVYGTIDPSSEKSNPDARRGIVNAVSVPEPTSTTESVRPAGTPVAPGVLAEGGSFACVVAIALGRVAKLRQVPRVTISTRAARTNSAAEDRQTKVRSLRQLLHHPV